MCLLTVFVGHNAISTAAPQEPKLQNFLLVEQKKEGFGLTIAARADINLFKLMEVSVLLCYGGMSSIPGHLL